MSGLGVSGESEVFSCGENGVCWRGDRGPRIGDQGLSNGEGGANPDGRGLMGDGFCSAAPFVFGVLPSSSRLRRYCTTSVWTSKVSRRRVVSTLWGSTARFGSMRTDALNFVPGTYTKHFVPVLLFQ